ncbi:MAG: hypothetical protein ACJ0BJ_10520 [Pirellulales bacterium]
MGFEKAWGFRLYSPDPAFVLGLLAAARDARGISLHILLRAAYCNGERILLPRPLSWPGTGCFDGFVAAGLGGLGLWPALAAAHFSATDFPSCHQQAALPSQALLVSASALAARSLSATDIRFLKPSGSGGASVSELLDSGTGPLAARNLSASDIFSSSDAAGCVTSWRS